MAKARPNTTLKGPRTNRRVVDIDLDDPFASFDDEVVMPGLGGLEALGFHVTSLPATSPEEVEDTTPELSEWYQQNLQELAVNAPLREEAARRRKQRTSVSRSQADSLYRNYRTECDLAQLMSEAPSC